MYLKPLLNTKRTVGTINWVLELRVLFCADEGNIVQGNSAKLHVQVCGSKRLGCHVGESEAGSPSSSLTNAYVGVQYVDQKGSATVLVAKRSAGVTPEVNLKNLLHAGKEAYEQGIHPGFETQGTCHQRSKTGVLVDPQTGLMSSKNYWIQVLLTIVLVFQQVIAVACEIIQNTSLNLAGLYFVFKLFE